MSTDNYPSPIETIFGFSTDGSISVQNLISELILYFASTTLCQIFEDPMEYINETGHIEKYHRLRFLKFHNSLLFCFEIFRHHQDTLKYSMLV